MWYIGQATLQFEERMEPGLQQVLVFAEAKTAKQTIKRTAHFYRTELESSLAFRA